MLRTLNTLMRGLVNEAEDAVIDRNALILLDQKIRDTESGLNAAKLTLAGLVKRDRLEERQLDCIAERTADLEPRVSAALAAGDDVMATAGATALADLENEAKARQATRAELVSRINRLRHGLGTATRRLADLRQAAATARAVDLERRGQRGVATGYSSSVAEAEALVARILGQEDPFEDARILQDIDDGLTGGNASETLAAAGYGAPRRATADSVLRRLGAAGPAAKSD